MMITKTEIKQIEETLYIAEDGREFKDELDCMKYEWNSKATVVYGVFKRGNRHTLEVYSTNELADRAINGSDMHSVSEIRLDERFWRDEYGF